METLIETLRVNRLLISDQILWKSIRLAIRLGFKSVLSLCHLDCLSMLAINYNLGFNLGLGLGLGIGLGLGLAQDFNLVLDQVLGWVLSGILSCVLM